MIINKNNISSMINHSIITKAAKNVNISKANEANGNFNELLTRKTQEKLGIKFSKHAQQRLISRDISLSKDDRELLWNALQKAGNKGVNDSLILMRDMAFVVNIKNKTVITAMKNNEMKENVVTNIDGAIIA
jgi:flagellar operon protein